jgi:hypothetical protein
MQDRPIWFEKRRSARILSSDGIWIDDGGDGVFDVGGPILDGSEDVVGGRWGAGLERTIDSVSTAATCDIARHTV